MAVIRAAMLVVYCEEDINLCPMLIRVRLVGNEYWGACVCILGRPDFSFNGTVLKVR